MKSGKEIAAAMILASSMLAGVVPGMQCAVASAVEITEENLPKFLEKLFRERPELVMDVLRRQSESVLDIAQQGSNMRRLHSLEAQWAADMKVNKTVKTEGRPVMGAPKAKVRIVAFSDFTCHFCQQASKTVDAILQEYGKDVSLVFKNMPLDEKGPANIASAYFVAISQQSEEKAWQFYKALFADRDKLIADGEAFLKKTAEGLNVDMKRLAKDVHSKKVTDIIAEDQQDAQKLGIEGTPYFLVNNLVVRGALPLDLFKSAVDMALKNSK